jgi:AhpD family alkylhydroperoxidase
MTQRIDYQAHSPELFKKFAAFSMAFAHSPIEEALRDLVDVRASQLNGCTFCVDMHVKAATKHGERPLRLHHLAVWRESQLFSARERAALEWTEVLTQIPTTGVPDEVYSRVRAEFSEQEVSDLTFLVMSINAWNRVNVAFQVPPGLYDKVFGVDGSGLS